MKRNPHEKTMVHASLQAAGIPVPVEDPSGIEPDLQVESLKGSRIFDLKMGFECLLNVRISNHSYANLKIELQGHLLEASWELTFQEYPKQHAPGCKAYRMLSGRKVRYKSVLNHRLNDEIAPGASVEGKLLALSVVGKIPEDYIHGQRVPLELILTDQYGRQFPSIFECTVDRSATMSKPEVFHRVGGGLYGGCPLETPKFEYRVPLQVPVGRTGMGESVGKESEPMKMLAACIAYLAKTDRDTIPAESTSTREQRGVDSRRPQEQRDNVRAGEGSALSGLDAIGEPADLFEEDARRRYRELVSQEKVAEQRRGLP